MPTPIKVSGSVSKNGKVYISLRNPAILGIILFNEDEAKAFVNDLSTKLAAAQKEKK